jgi:hypothetical protein
MERGESPATASAPRIRRGRKFSYFGYQESSNYDFTNRQNAKVDLAFFAGTSVKSNFLCNLGYGDTSKLYPRSPRLSFAEACQIM